MYRYEIFNILGKGSFGQVVRAYDYKTQQMVAIKVIRNKSRFHKQALVEVKVLRHLTEHDPSDETNSVRMLDHFTFRGHLCIVFELLSSNLYEFIKSNNFLGVSLPLIRRFAVQVGASSMRPLGPLAAPLRRTPPAVPARPRPPPLFPCPSFHR